MRLLSLGIQKVNLEANLAVSWHPTASSLKAALNFRGTDTCFGEADLVSISYLVLWQTPHSHVRIGMLGKSVTKQEKPQLDHW